VRTKECGEGWAADNREDERWGGKKKWMRGNIVWLYSTEKCLVFEILTSGGQLTPFVVFNSVGMFCLRPPG